jgi:heat shock protein 4
VDFGHSKLTLSTVAFTREKIAVVSEMSEGNLGCRDMDWVMLEFYAEVFRRSSKGGDVMGSSKAVVKLLEVIEKQRKVLSANS